MRILFIVVMVIVAGCVSTPYPPPAVIRSPQGAIVPPAPAPIVVPGFYHRVQKGQTLWRISKMYNVELDELTRVNRISDATAIEIGQMILIPGAKKAPVSVSVAGSPEEFAWPMRGRTISTFGQTHGDIVNKGINIQPSGSIDVHASRSGRVVYYEDNFGNFGKTLIIDHGDGFSSVYARNSDVYVKPGDYVQKGMLIGRAGSAGRDNAVYLHFEIRKANMPQNPLFYLS